MLTIAHHSDAVAVLENLGHAVRDVDDPDPPSGQLSHYPKEFLRLVLSQCCGRLVKDQDATVQRKGLGDLDQLLLGDRQSPCGKPGVDVGQRRQDLGSAGDQVGPTHQPSAGPGSFSHEDVLSHGNVSTQRDLLVHETDPQTLRHGRAVDPDGLPVDADGPAVGLQDSIDDVHQRGFSGTILTGKRMNFPCLQLKPSATQSADRAKGFGDVGQLQKGRGCVGHESFRKGCAPPLSRQGGGPQLRPSM